MHPSAPFSGRRRWPSSLLVAALAAPLLCTTAPTTAQGSTPVPPAVAEAPSSRHQVTLVTGDVVTVTTLADGRQLADVDRPDGAVGGVRMQQSGGDLYVI